MSLGKTIWKVNCWQSNFSPLTDWLNRHIATALTQTQGDIKRSWIKQELIFEKGTQQNPQ